RAAGSPPSRPLLFARPGSPDGAPRHPGSAARAREEAAPAFRLRSIRATDLGSLRPGHQLEHVAVRVLEIDAAAAGPVLELAVVKAPRGAAVGEARLLHPTEDGIELRLADVEGVVVALERVVVVEQQGQRVVHLDRREVTALGTEVQAEDAGEEARGGDLV